METERISQKTFDSLPEYSCSLPTGKTVGKVWKRNLNFGNSKPPEWVICEYVPDPDPEYLLVEKRRLEITQ